MLDNYINKNPPVERVELLYRYIFVYYVAVKYGLSV